MKTKLSMTLSTDVVKGIDQVAGRKHSRSAVVNAVLRRWLKTRERARINAHDAEIYLQHAAELNEQALDVLAYQDLGGDDEAR